MHRLISRDGRAHEKCLIFKPKYAKIRPRVHLYASVQTFDQTNSHSLLQEGIVKTLNQACASLSVERKIEGFH